MRGVLPEVEATTADASMNYEKRSARIGGYVRPSLREFYERIRKSHPNKSLSDVVCEALEDQAAILIAKQKIGARIGQQ